MGQRVDAILAPDPTPQGMYVGEGLLPGLVLGADRGTDECDLLGSEEVQSVPPVVGRGVSLAPKYHRTTPILLVAQKILEALIPA